MRPVNIEGEFTKVPDESWKDRLVTARRRLIERTVPAFIEFCQEVHAFRKDCESTSGGSEFTAKGCEWLGVSASQLHRWAAVGMRAPELLGAPKSLPPSEDSICRIASLDDVAFRRVLPLLRQDMPQREVRELLKEQRLPPSPPTEEETEEQWKKKRNRLCAQFAELPEKHQFVAEQFIRMHLGAVNSENPDPKPKLKSKQNRMHGLPTSQERIDTGWYVIGQMVPPSQRKTFRNAVSEMLRLMVDDEARAATKTLRDQARKTTKEAQEKVDEFTTLSEGVKAFMLLNMNKEEFKLVRSCLHPDREAPEERKARAFDILNRLEKQL